LGEIFERFVSPIVYPNTISVKIWREEPKEVGTMETITPQLLKINDVCVRTSLSRSTIYREIESGRLRAVKRGKSIRVTETALADFIASLEAVEVK
jgi:excisionase family DNA binding protein